MPSQKALFLLTVFNRCARAGMTSAEGENIIHSRKTGCPRAWLRPETAVVLLYNHGSPVSRTTSTGAHGRAGAIAKIGACPKHTSIHVPF